MEAYYISGVEGLRKRSKEIADNYNLVRNGKEDLSIDIPNEFRTDIFALVDKINLNLLEDRDNFFGYFLFQMSREIRFDIGSATAVNFKGARYVIYFNPVIFLNLSIDQMETTIKHEVLHIISMHLVRAREYKKNYSKIAINMAMDIVVNGYLNNLPPYATTLERVNYKYALQLEPYAAFEYYIEKIQAAMDSLDTDEIQKEKKTSTEEHASRVKEVPEEEEASSKKDASKENEVPEENGDHKEKINTEFSPEKTHDIWEESNGYDEKTLQEFTEKVINDSEKGTIPSYLNGMIAALKNSGGELPWNLYLQRIMGTVESNKKKTVTRRNRRQPERLDLRGELKSHKAKIAVALDISGSISDEEFKQAMKEVLNIVRNYNHEITMIECDDEIRRIYQVKSEKDIKERHPVRGGTKYNPVFEYANKNKMNLLVYFTDGKGEDKLKTIPRGYQILWVISGNGDQLSLQEPYGAVKKLKKIEVVDDIPEVSEVVSSGLQQQEYL